MANEAVWIEGPYETHDFTCDTGTGILQGTLLNINEPRSLSGVAADGGPFAGIAATEKEAGSNQTELGLHTRGIFKLTAVATIGDEGAIIDGSMVVLSGLNLIRKAEAADLLTGAVIGKALEDIAAGTQGEVFVGQS